MDERPSYRGIKSDYYTHCHDLPPQIGRCLFLPEAEPFTAEIDGGAWSVTMVSRNNTLVQGTCSSILCFQPFLIYLLSHYVHSSSSLPPSHCPHSLRLIVWSPCCL